MCLPVSRARCKPECLGATSAGLEREPVGREWYGKHDTVKQTDGSGSLSQRSGEGSTASEPPWRFATAESIAPAASA